MANIVLIRGLPGSGKSTLGKKFIKYNYEHIETDMFFINKNNEYNFDKTKLSEAHDWCFSKTESILKTDSNVVVSNTFSTFNELYPYINISYKYNYAFVIIKCCGNFKSIHNVPNYSIENMSNRFEKIAGEILFMSKY